MELKTFTHFLDFYADKLFGFGTFDKALNELGDRCTNIQIYDILGKANRDYTLQIAEAACNYHKFDIMEKFESNADKTKILNTPQPDIDKLLK